MTLPHKTLPTRLRENHPEWDIWSLGRRWWAKLKRSTMTLDADDLDALALLLTEVAE